MTDMEFVLGKAGFVIAGDIWGSAAWKMHKDKLYSLGQGREGDFLAEPTDLHAETCLWIYQGPFDAGWDAQRDGLPLTSRGTVPDSVTFIFPNVFNAIAAVATLMEAKPWPNNPDLDANADLDLALDAEFINPPVDLRGVI